MPSSQKVKRRGGYEAAAVRHLERARKVVARDGDGDSDASVQVMVSSANVYALLELADAIRAAFGRGSESVNPPAPSSASPNGSDEDLPQDEDVPQDQADAADDDASAEEAR